ncbi:MAG: helicase-related protein, partial [Burkholderiales bacterium]
LYTKVHNHEVDILVGTQMLAKGHDFPNLTLVVGLNIDSGLYSHDFRASELLFTQLTQVGGRAGRGTKPGLVLLQTHYPNHELYQYLIKHDFSGFANYLLNQRKPLLLPPYSHYALLRVSASKLKTAMEYLAQIASLAQQLISAEIVMYPPVPAIIQRLKSRERGQILIYSQNRDSLHKFLTQLTELISQLKAKADVSWNLDVDPSEL